MGRKFPRTCQATGCRKPTVAQYALPMHKRHPLCDEHLPAATKAAVKAAQDRPKSGRVKRRPMTPEERAKYGLPPLG